MPGHVVHGEGGVSVADLQPVTRCGDLRAVIHPAVRQGGAGGDAAGHRHRAAELQQVAGVVGGDGYTGDSLCGSQGRGWTKIRNSLVYNNNGRQMLPA